MKIINIVKLKTLKLKYLLINVKKKNESFLRDLILIMMLFINEIFYQIYCKDVRSSEWLWIVSNFYTKLTIYYSLIHSKGSFKSNGIDDLSSS